MNDDNEIEMPVDKKKVQQEIISLLEVLKRKIIELELETIAYCQDRCCDGCPYCTNDCKECGLLTIHSKLKSLIKVLDKFPPPPI